MRPRIAKKIQTLLLRSAHTDNPRHNPQNLGRAATANCCSPINTLRVRIQHGGSIFNTCSSLRACTSAPRWQTMVGQRNKHRYASPSHTPAQSTHSCPPDSV